MGYGVCCKCRILVSRGHPINNPLASLRRRTSNASTKLALAISITTLCLGTSGCGLLSGTSGISPERLELHQQMKQDVHDLYDANPPPIPRISDEDYANACIFFEDINWQTSLSTNIDPEVMDSAPIQTRAAATFLEHVAIVSPETAPTFHEAGYTVQDFCEDLPHS